MLPGHNYGSESPYGVGPPPKRPRVSDALNASQSSISRQMTNASPVGAKLEWTIANFDKLIKLYKPGNNLTSRPFSSALAPDVVWELHVYPNGKREEDTGQVSFFLRQIGMVAKQEPVQCEFQIYCAKSNGEKASVCRDTKDFVFQQGRGKFQVARDKLAPALSSDGALMVVCEVEYCLPGQRHAATEESAADTDFWMGANTSEAQGDDTAATSRGRARGAVDLKRLFTEQIFPDCALVVSEGGENRTLRAHRCILALHSQVFASMLSHRGMTEADSGVITITDSSFAPVKAMLEFMYSKDGELDTNYAEDVLVLADKYDLKELKAVCERFLVSKLTDDAVCDMLTLADTHNAHRLKAACTLYLASNRATALHTDDWLRLKTSQPLLANDILEHIVMQGSPMASPHGALASSSSAAESSGTPGTSRMRCVCNDDSAKQRDQPQPPASNTRRKITRRHARD